MITECIVFNCEETATRLGVLTYDDPESTWEKQVAYCDQHALEFLASTNRDGLTLTLVPEVAE